nr:Sec-independent protein translocase subunit TatA [Crossiella equi]
MGVPELLIIAVVVVLLFGAKKMPDMARAVGRSMRIFKAETKTMREEDGDAAPQAQQPVQQPAPQAPQQPYAAQPLPPTQPVVQQPAPQVAPPLEQTQGRDNR